MTDGVESRVTAFLGLCMRAGRVTSGQEAGVSLIREGGAALVLMDEAASGNTQKRVTDACHAHDTPLYRVSAGVLGHSIGKQGRMVAVLAPDGMADKLLSILKDEPRL